ncbi:hypothetical protein ACVOMV_16880 [Mesorhizobium atlanticum]
MPSSAFLAPLGTTTIETAIVQLENRLDAQNASTPSRCCRIVGHCLLLTGWYLPVLATAALASISSSCFLAS